MRQEDRCGLIYGPPYDLYQSFDSACAFFTPMEKERGSKLVREEIGLCLPEKSSLRAYQNFDELVQRVSLIALSLQAY